MRHHVTWLAATALVLSAWIAGRVAWQPYATEGFGIIRFSWFWDVALFVLHLPVVLAGVRLVRSVRLLLRVLGWVLTGGAIVSLVFAAFVSSLGGFCLDPGEDTCVLSTASHVAHGVTPVAVVLTSWFYAKRLQGKRG